MPQGGGGAGYDISLAASDTKAFKIGDFAPVYGMKLNWQIAAVAGVVLLLVVMVVFKRSK